MGLPVLAISRHADRCARESAYPPRADIRAPMFVTDRGLEVIFCWKFSEPIIGRGYFDGLFLQGGCSGRPVEREPRWWSEAGAPPLLKTGSRAYGIAGGHLKFAPEIDI